MTLYKPLLGSAAIKTPMFGSARSRHVDTSPYSRVQPSVCDIIKEYRKLDDAITMRLNLSVAQWQDRDRHAERSSSRQDPCEYLWKELVANWRGRKEVIDYCVDIMDKVVDEKRGSISGQEEGVDTDRGSRSVRSSIFGEEVLRNQIRQEFTVEAIIRRRSWEASASRHRHFEPPKTDVEARKWWDAAEAARQEG